MKIISFILFGIFLSSCCISNVDFDKIKDLTKEGMNIVKSCTNALMQVVPPMWCWKKNGDAGVLPTGCPEGYFRSAALCYRNCNNGYSFFGGVCYERCKAGFKDHGLSCYKHLFKWYFKKSYIPRSITNFSSEIPCPGASYRGGALCYRDCKLIFMENCGIGACASDSFSCATTIIKMITDVITGLIDFISFCLSFGSSSGVVAAKGQLAGAAKKVGSQGIKSAFQTLKNVFAKKFKSAIENKAKELARKLFLVDPIIKSFSAQVGDLCGAVFGAIEGKLPTSPLPTAESLVESLDVFGIVGIAKSCSSGDGLNCAKSVLTSLKSFDPTGLLTIATTFMQPVCSVPMYANSNSIENSESVPFIVDYVDSSCINFYSEAYFKGDVTTICGSQNEIQAEFPPFRSIRSSIDSVFSFYSKPNYQGTQMKIGKGGLIEDMSDLIYYTAEGSITNHLKSVRLLRDQCIYLTLKKNGEDYNREICESMANIKLGFADGEVYLLKGNRNSKLNEDELFNLDSELNSIFPEPFDNFFDDRIPPEGDYKNIGIRELNSIDNEQFDSISIQTSDSTTAQIFDGEHFSGNSQTIGEENQQLSGNQLTLSRIKSIKLNFNYNAQGFLCDNEAETSEIIRQNGDEVECFSYDGINCLKKKMNKIQCAKYVNKNIRYAKPLKCGLDYKKEFDVIGYLIEGHWCQKGMKYFKVEPSILE